MANLASLEKEGWFVCIDKLKNYLGEVPDENIPADKFKAYLLDLDIKNFGASKLNDCLDRKKGVFDGPLVLQLKSWQNISCAKISEHKENDGLCKVTLYDGFSTVSGLQIDLPLPINGLTSYGTKFLLTGRIFYECGFLLLDGKNCKLLGGKVEKLIEKWKISQISTGKKIEKSADYTKFQPYKQTNKFSDLDNTLRNLNLFESGNKEKQYKKGNDDHNNALNRPKQSAQNNQKKVKNKSYADSQQLQNHHDQNCIKKRDPPNLAQKNYKKNPTANDQSIQPNNHRNDVQHLNSRHDDFVSKNNYNDNKGARDSNTNRNLAWQCQNDLNIAPPGFVQPGHDKFHKSYLDRNLKQNPNKSYKQQENHRFFPPPRLSKNLHDFVSQNDYSTPNTFNQPNNNANFLPIPQRKECSNNGSLPLQESVNVLLPHPVFKSSDRGKNSGGQRVYYRRFN